MNQAITRALQPKPDERLVRLMRQSGAAMALAVGLLCGNAQAIDSFFDIWVELGNSGQLNFQPVNSGAFPFPPPPLDFPDLPTLKGDTVDVQIVSLDLHSSPRTPMVITPDQGGGSGFRVDSFFDIVYELQVDDGSPLRPPVVDSFFDVPFQLQVEPQSVIVLPNGDEQQDFDIEIVSMGLTAPLPAPLDPPVGIQLLPPLSSEFRGHVTVLKSPAPGGGDVFQVDSFFDVFVELSPEGGPSIPSTQNSLVRLQSSVTVPEPGSLLLGAIVGGAFLIRRRSK